MKQVYIKFKEDFELYNQDYEDANLIYNKEINMLAINNVKEIKCNGETIKVYYTNKRYEVVYNTNTIIDIVVN